MFSVSALTAFMELTGHSSFGLREEQHNPRPFWGREAPLCFLGCLGGNHSIAGLVKTRFPIHQHDVAMRPVTLDVVQQELPGSGRRIITQGELAPPAERADDLDGGRLGRLSGWNRPTEDSREASLPLSGFRLGKVREGRREPECGRAGPGPAVVLNVVGDAIDHKFVDDSLLSLWASVWLRPLAE